MNVVWRVIRGIAIVIYAFYYLTIKFFVGSLLQGKSRLQ